MGIYNKLNSASKMWGNNYIPQQNLDGSWSKINTSTYAVLAMQDNTRALVVWYDSDNKLVAYAVEGVALDWPALFNLYWKTKDPQFLWWTSTS